MAEVPKPTGCLQCEQINVTLLHNRDHHSLHGCSTVQLDEDLTIKTRNEHHAQPS